MSKQANREGLSMGYRIMYQIKRALLTVYGPAQLSGDADPHVRMKRQRDSKVAAARQARLEREPGQGS